MENRIYYFKYILTTQGYIYHDIFVSIIVTNSVNIKRLTHVVYILFLVFNIFHCMGRSKCCTVVQYTVRGKILAGKFGEL